MMSNFPERLLEFSRVIAAADPENGRTNEQRDYLDVVGRLDQEAADRCRTLLEESRANGIKIGISDSFGESIPAEDLRTGPVNIRITKPNTPSLCHAFTVEGVNRILEDPASHLVRRVAVATDIVSFSTVSCLFNDWNAGSSEIDDRDPLGDVEPRRYVFEQQPNLVPKRVGDMLLIGDPPSASPVFDEWKRAAWRRLPLVLCSEVGRTELGLTLVFRGAGPVRVSFDHASQADDAALSLVMEAVRWVYAEGSGVQNRHAFLNAEFARLWPRDSRWEERFEDILPMAMEGARSANELLLSGKSGDVLKSLADLRKSVNDDVGRLTQQMRELGGSLWRDFVVAVTALSARAALTANNSAVTWGIRLTLLFAAAFLAYSVFVNVRGNRRTLEIAETTRQEWNSRVYAFLPTSEIEALGNAPIKNAKQAYRGVERNIVFAYVVMVSILVLSAVWQIEWNAVVTQWSSNVANKFQEAVKILHAQGAKAVR